MKLEIRDKTISRPVSSFETKNLTHSPESKHQWKYICSSKPEGRMNHYAVIKLQSKSYMGVKNNKKPSGIIFNFAGSSGSNRKSKQCHKYRMILQQKIANGPGPSHCYPIKYGPSENLDRKLVFGFPRWTGLETFHLT